jgi:acyl carrier protein
MDVMAQVRAVVASAFNLPPESVTGTTSQENTEAWDSMGHLTLVLALEQEFGIMLAPEDVERMNDVATIAALISRQLQR